MQPGRGSLAEVFPTSLIDRFAVAAAGTGAVTWRASSGAAHGLRVCPSAPVETTAGASSGHMHQMSSENDFGHLDDRIAARQTVASAIAVAIDQPVPAAFDGEESDRLVGSLVHRLLQREGLPVEVSDTWMAERLASLVRVEESIALADRDDVIRRAAAAYRAFSMHQELRALYLSGTAFHEVPFSLSVDDRIVRGTIDCLVRGANGDVAVLEFKTGRRRPEHDAQTALYRQAAQSLFPGSRVVTQLLYTADSSRF
jgi:ATP-dependent exoDNAse (exonuclease V) beta subunit